MDVMGFLYKLNANDKAKHNKIISNAQFRNLKKQRRKQERAPTNPLNQQRARAAEANARAYEQT